MYRFIFLFIISCFLSYNTIAQKTYKLTDLFIQAIEGDSAVVHTSFIDSVSTEGLEELFDLDLYNFLKEKGYATDSSGRIIINNAIEIGRNFIDEFQWGLKLEKFRFKKPISIAFDNLSIERFWIENCVFENDLFIQLTSTCNDCSLEVNNNTFFGDTELHSKNLRVFNNIFKNRVSSKMAILKSVNASFHYSNFINDSLCFLVKPWDRDAIIYDKSVQLYGSDIISFSGNQFSNNFSLLKIKGKVSELFLGKNKIKGIIDISNIVIDQRLIMLNNYLNGYFDVSQTVFPEVYRKIRWDENSKFKLAVSNNTKIPFLGELPKSLPKSFIYEVKGDTTFLSNETYYLGKSHKELKDDLIYDLKASYQKLSEIYKENADQQAANWAYAEMMNLEGKRLKEIYKKEKNFRNFFRWQLNSLMKVYTNHGTDPALAITISMYVILFFALIYFFFPSEWDVTSKSKLIKDFKNFREKNDKGYLIPFLNVVMGLVISLVNAITLSLNSFTTLGFGNIPTKGLARYLTIIQGFVGWFLLGLFSVSLINQVLA